MAKTKIEWATHTWNPITGCSPVSEGCQNCYAKRMAKRLAGRAGYPADEPFRVTLHPDRLDEPLHWKKPRNVFVVSMGDLFHEDIEPIQLSMIFQVIEKCPQHTFMLLTKRPETALKHSKNVMLSRYFRLPNIWLGVTAENQKQADERIPILLQIPAAVRFVSVEPMLGPVRLKTEKDLHEEAAGMSLDPMFFGFNRINPDGICLDWVICGCESGPGARPMHPDWARSLRDQCQTAGVPFFLKQMKVNGKMVKMPKLDGQAWGQFPEIQSKKENENG